MKRIKSPNSLNEICSFFLYSTTLNIVKYSKCTQKYFNIDINDYVIYSQLKNLIQKDEYDNMGWYYDFLCINYPTISKEKIKKCLFEYLVYYTRQCNELRLNLLHHLTLEIVNHSNIENIYLVIQLRELITSGNINLIDKTNIIGIDIQLRIEEKNNEELINSLFNNIIGNSVKKLHLNMSIIENQNSKRLLLSKIEQLNPNIEQFTIDGSLSLNKNTNLDSIMMKYTKMKQLKIMVPMMKIKFNSVKTLIQTMNMLTELKICCDVLHYSQFEKLITPETKRNIKQLSLSKLSIDTNENHFSSFISLEKLALSNTKEKNYLNLSKLSTLKELHLSETPITTDTLIDSLLNSEGTIESLIISYFDIKTITKSKEDFLSIIPNLTHLKKLYIYEFFSKSVDENKKYTITSNFIEDITLSIANGFNIKRLFENCPKVKKVCLYYCPLVRSANQTILDLPDNINHLESLSLLFFKTSLNYPKEFTFNPPENFKNLIIDLTCADNNMIEFIKRLCSKSKNITSLYFRSPFLDDYHPFFNCISHIIAQSKYLRIFSLISTNIEDEIITKLIISLKQCKLLQVLKINNSTISIENINQLIANKEDWSSLVTLEIYNDYISEKPVDLTELSKCYKMLNK